MRKTKTVIGLLGTVLIGCVFAVGVGRIAFSVSSQVSNAHGGQAYSDTDLLKVCTRRLNSTFLDLRNCQSQLSSCQSTTGSPIVLNPGLSTLVQPERGRE